MVTTQVNLAEVKLSDLVVRAANGEDILIARVNKPRVRHVPIRRRPSRRPGALKGKIWMAPDFDEDLSDLFECLQDDDGAPGLVERSAARHARRAVVAGRTAAGAGCLAAIADRQREAWVGIASLWGLAIKRSVGRFRLREDLADVLVTEGFALLGVETPHEHVGCPREPAAAPP